MIRPKLLTIDLDGTILQYDGSEGSALGQPIPGIKEELQKIRDAGLRIAIWTVRSNVDEIRAKLTEYGIPFDYINNNPDQPSDGSDKLYADVYVDDRAISFNGKSQGLADKVLNFQPWWDKMNKIEQMIEAVAAGADPATVLEAKANLLFFVTPRYGGKEGPFLRATGFWGDGADDIIKAVQHVLPGFNGDMKIDPRLEIKILDKVYDAVKSKFDASLDKSASGKPELSVQVK